MARDVNSAQIAGILWGDLQMQVNQNYKAPLKQEIFLVKKVQKWMKTVFQLSSSDHRNFHTK
jgi:hypothetical protein